ncbi:hypothetical protein G6F46_012660 [Rhizopus delemar]|uniref:Cytochrome P450 n=3 Tax=Rhizopus TaxID=4842 RepID=I1BW49_RHIO9|nr:hypothetical protein RO3G_05127 [Rhizopus delemar RA 99-880]KAG1451363.1 hypothetical protein G6F55_009224 [Rhizopus delemar]KAG1533089.1 hypothetical protein G6F51_012788 [Rhizopus arrhizus]EIE80429.1 hypothetical protein RO3G_05134 [Rhizopus delemar RA 99-880]KAG1498562.1 hypothetical protein G6F54_004994 [Rhizopus delemar]|eukprot:EIE80422.1 hypothetical protein RO3G_05127 [Rhizopus delemar RA 99-880]
MNQETLQIVQKNITNYVEKWKSSEKLDAVWAAKLGLSSVAAYFLYKTIIYRLYIHPANRLPGPRVSWIPFMGNFFEIIRTEDDQSPLRKWAKTYGSIYTIHTQLNKPEIVVTDEKLVKQILTTQVYDFEKPDIVSRELERLTGRGVLVVEGQAHRIQRKMLNPAFSVQSIRAMVPLMLGPGYTLRDQWLHKISESNTEYTEIEVSKSLSLATLDVIGITAFGQDFKSLSYYGTEKMNRLSKAYLSIFSNEMATMQILSIVFPILRYLPTKRNREEAKMLRWIKEESAALVEAGIQRDQEEKRSGKINQSKDLLALMVNLIDEDTGKGFTKEELRDQCLTFLAAGHETTSNTLCWCLWLLAQNQDIQDKLRAEILPLFKDGKISNYDAVNAIPYLDYVCRETLRLIPTVPDTNRINRVPVVLGSYVIPKDTTFHIPPVVSQRSKEIWGEDADEFNPSRWEKSENIGNAYQYFPFLAGGHQCIGHKFATVEMKVLLSILIKDIQFFEKPGFKVQKKQIITMRPIPNMTLWIKPVSSS